MCCSAVQCVTECCCSFDGVMQCVAVRHRCRVHMRPAPRPAKSVAVRCSLLLCVAVCFNVLLCVAVRCRASQMSCIYATCLQAIMGCCSVLLCVVAVRCSALQMSCTYATFSQARIGCCSVLQSAAVCCSVSQCVAACCSVLQCVAVRCRCNIYTRPFRRSSRGVAVCCSLWQRVAVCCHVLQRVAVRCSALQCVADVIQTRNLLAGHHRISEILARFSTWHSMAVTATSRAETATFRKEGPWYVMCEHCGGGDVSLHLS